MESVFGRYKNLIWLVIVLFVQVLGLAVQVKRGNDQEHTRLIRIWVVGAITPFERGLVWIENGGSDVWRNYFYLRGVRAENRQLKEQIEQMRLEQVRLSEDAAQARRLQSLLAFKEQYVAKTVAAQVIGTSGTDSNRVIYIDKGENAGIRRDMAVMTADGIVGKVSLVYASESQILLINDQTSGVGVLLGDERTQGVLSGTANGRVVLNDVMSDNQVPLGEKLLTSGGDRIFPKGLPVGTVAKVGRGKDLFLNIEIKPAADLSRLEEVLVLTEKEERQAIADDSGRAMRAADILAARLPSVPEKPADTAATAGATPKPADSAAPAAGTNGASNLHASSALANGATQSPQTVKAPANNATASTPAKSQTAAPKSANPQPKTAKPAASDHSAAQSPNPQQAPNSSPTQSQTAPPNTNSPN
jgi:rod shape-determining protein MreC